MHHLKIYMSVGAFFIISNFLGALDVRDCPQKFRLEEFDNALQQRHRQRWVDSIQEDPTKARNFFVDNTLKTLLNCGDDSRFSLSSGRMKLNFTEQTISISPLDRWTADKFVIRDVGAYLLLWAVKNHEAHSIERLLKKPERLADLSVTDAQGKNALVLAEEFLSSQEKGISNFDQWQNIVAKLRKVFGYLAFSENSNQPHVADFVWQPLSHIPRSEPSYCVLSGENLYHCTEIRWAQSHWWGKCETK